MPWGYLITVALVAICTGCAVAPLRRPPRAGRMMWMLGMVPNELPFVVFAYLAAATLVAALQHDLDTAIGLIGLALAILSTVALVVIVWRATRTRAIVAFAMRDALRVDVPGSRLSMLHILLAPFVVTRRDVRRTADIPYGDGRSRLLDVHLPRHRGVTGPVLVYFHGGGYRGGAKNREARPLVSRLASQGWLCVSASYALRPAPFSDSLADARAAVAWARTHARELGAESVQVFVAGSSAGGHLALCVALTDPTTTGAVSLYGYYGTAEDGQLDTSPLGLAGPEAPPLFVAHGDNDTYVPVEAAREFVTRVREVSANPVVYIELPGAQHSFDLFRSIRFERLIDGIGAFTGCVRATEQADAQADA
jgi:acetyl esterase/lipase